MKKRGFTLIELLAVIIILAVIALIAMPLIMNVINDAKKNSFKDSAYGIIKAVEYRVMEETTDGENRSYKLDVTGSTINYNGERPDTGWAKVDINGITTLYMKNKSYCAYKDIEVTGKEEVVITDNPSDCDEGIKGIKNDENLTLLKRQLPVNNCTFDGELAQGTSYTNGQYTYRYMQYYYGGNTWNNMTDDGWGVAIADPTSTDPVTTKICTTINGKPIVDMQNMFNNSQAESIDFSSYDTSHVKNMSSMFRSEKSLTKLDLSGFDTSSVTNISSIFNGASNLESINMDGWDISNVTSVGGAFFGTSSLKEISMKDWRIGRTTLGGFGRYWTGMDSPIETINVSGWNLSETTSINATFENLSQLKTIIGLDTWDTSHVTDMGELFQMCSSIETLDLSTFDTSNVTTMASIFGGMTSLKELNLDNWDFRKTNMGALFLTLSSGGFANIKKITLNHSRHKNLDNLFYNLSTTLEEVEMNEVDTASAISAYGMFKGNSALKSVSLLGLDTSNVIDTGSMFEDCSNLKRIDLSSFNTSKVTTMANMFKNCSSLEQIVVSKKFVTDNVSPADMFQGCTSIKGGYNTGFDDTKIKLEYAHIDGGSSNPGYFTTARAGVIMSNAYVAPTSTDTHKGIVYLDPTDIYAECNATKVAANKQGTGYEGSCVWENGTRNCTYTAVESTLEETKSGCMKWYVYEEVGGEPSMAILDHIISYTVYDFENSTGSSRQKSAYEIEWQLDQDTKNWNYALAARIPTAQELAVASGFTGFSPTYNSSYFYQYIGGSSSNATNYDWIFGVTNSLYHQRYDRNGNLAYNSYTGFWTTTVKNSSQVWGIRNDGRFDDIQANQVYGIRPVISLAYVPLVDPE